MDSLHACQKDKKKYEIGYCCSECGNEGAVMDGEELHELLKIWGWMK